MAGLVPAIYGGRVPRPMAGTSPAMTMKGGHQRTGFLVKERSDPRPVGMRGERTIRSPHTIPFLTVGDESFDIGADTRTPVDDKDCQVPFQFNGKIDKLTYKLGSMRLTEADQMKLRRAVAVAKD